SPPPGRPRSTSADRSGPPASAWPASASPVVGQARLTAAAGPLPLGSAPCAGSAEAVGAASAIPTPAPTADRARRRATAGACPATARSPAAQRTPLRYASVQPSATSAWHPARPATTVPVVTAASSTMPSTGNSALPRPLPTCHARTPRAMAAATRPTATSASTAVLRRLPGVDAAGVAPAMVVDIVPPVIVGFPGECMVLDTVDVVWCRPVSLFNRRWSGVSTGRATAVDDGGWAHGTPGTGRPLGRARALGGTLRGPRRAGLGAGGGGGRCAGVRADARRARDDDAGRPAPGRRRRGGHGRGARRDTAARCRARCRGRVGGAPGKGAGAGRPS